MGNGVFVSCAFSRPERTYDRMASAIAAAGGACVEVHFGLWHLATDRTAAEIRDRLKPALDVNDQLVVMEVARGGAAWVNLGKNAVASLRTHEF